MATVSTDEIRNNPERYLARVRTGEVLVILDADLPVARTEPLQQPQQVLRPYGLAKGMFRVPDDFDDPLPEETTAEFEGR